MMTLLSAVLVGAVAVAGGLNCRDLPRMITTFLLCGLAAAVMEIVAQIDRLAFLVLAPFVFAILVVGIIVVAPGRRRLWVWRLWRSEIVTPAALFMATFSGAWVATIIPLAHEPHIGDSGASVFWVAITTALLVFAVGNHNKTTPGFDQATPTTQVSFSQAWSRMISLGVVAIVLISILVAASGKRSVLDGWSPVYGALLLSTMTAPLLTWTLDRHSPTWWKTEHGRASRVVLMTVAVTVSIVAGLAVAPPEWKGIHGWEWVFVLVIAMLGGAYFAEDLLANALLNFESPNKPFREPLRPSTVFSAALLLMFAAWIVVSRIASEYVNGTSIDPSIWTSILVGSVQLGVLVWCATIAGTLTDRPELSRRKTRGSVRASMFVDSMMGVWLILAVVVATSQDLRHLGTTYAIVGGGILLSIIPVVRTAWAGHIKKERKRIAEDGIPPEFLVRLQNHGHFQKTVVVIAVGLVIAMEIIPALNSYVSIS